MLPLLDVFFILVTAYYAADVLRIETAKSVRKIYKHFEKYRKKGITNFIRNTKKVLFRNNIIK